MSIGFIIAILGGGAVLLAYALFEKRISQRSCPQCGFKSSRESRNRNCPRCAVEIAGQAEDAPEFESAPRSAATIGAQSHWIPRNWPKIALIFVPLCILAVDAAVIINERRQPEKEKAIGLVKESISRKEDFTVEQYLHLTVYYRKDRGEDIQIKGWRAEQPGGPSTPVMVQFSFSENGNERVAMWEVDVARGTTIPRSEAASEISWN